MHSTIPKSLSGGQLWEFSESLYPDLCFKTTWLTMSDQSCSGPFLQESCLQSQHRCRLPLEKCEYPGEIHGADMLDRTLCPHRQQEPALLLV